MLATLFGGPADGGELVLLEPIRGVLRFPMDHVTIMRTLAPRPGAHTIPNTVPAEYVLDITDGVPYRDPAGRVRYVYVLPTPTESETPTDEHRDPAP